MLSGLYLPLIIGAAETGVAPADPTPFIILAGAALIVGILIWQNSRAKKQFQLDLADERERTRQMGQERDLLAREN